MPNNPRQQIKADLNRAVNHADWIMDILVSCGSKYEEFHPEITEQYKTVFAYVEQLKLLIEGLRDAY